VGPADRVITHMLEHREESRVPTVTAAHPSLALQPIRPSKLGKLTTMDVVMTMNEVCPKDAVFTADMGEHLGVVLHYLRVREHGDFLTCLGFGSMGSGINSAIGYQLGAPHRRTFAVCGDGGFLMNGSELATAVQHHAATTFVVINDSRLNMVHHGHMGLFGRTPNFSTPLVDFAALARAMGAEGHVIETREELAAALDVRREGPVVLDVRIDPDVRLMGNQRVAALKQFKAGDDQ
jgi:acetolactate synthase-1/2/3 large subunit